MEVLNDKPDALNPMCFSFFLRLKELIGENQAGGEIGGGDGLGILIGNHGSDTLLGIEL